MRRALASMGIAAASLAPAGGCGGVAGCPAVRCQDGIHVGVLDVPAGTPFTLEVCVENECERHDVEGPGPTDLQPAVVVGEHRRTGRPYEVTVTATDRDGEVLLRHEEHVTIERELPHGDECPACRVGTLQVSFPD